MHKLERERERLRVELENFYEKRQKLKNDLRDDIEEFAVNIRSGHSVGYQCSVLAEKILSIIEELT